MTERIRFLGFIIKKMRHGPRLYSRSYTIRATAHTELKTRGVERGEEGHYGLVQRSTPPPVARPLRPAQNSGAGSRADARIRVGDHLLHGLGDHGLLWRRLQRRLWLGGRMFVDGATGLALAEHELLALGVKYAEREGVGLGGVHVEGVSAVLEGTRGVLGARPRQALDFLVSVPCHGQSLPLKLALVGCSDRQVGVVGHLLEARGLVAALVEMDRPLQVLEVVRWIHHIVGDQPGDVQALPVDPHVMAVTAVDRMLDVDAGMVKVLEDGALSHGVLLLL